VLYGSADADVGAVFGYEPCSKIVPCFCNRSGCFKGTAVVLSRYTVSLPEGWRAESVTFNSEPPTPRTTANTWTWEMRETQPIYTGELASPVSWPWRRASPSPSSRPWGEDGHGASVTKWPEVSRWLAALTDAQAVGSLHWRRKRAPDAGVSTGMEKAEPSRALFKASITFPFKPAWAVVAATVLIPPRGVSPSPMATVRDKANLMRTMLKTVGVDAFLTAIYSGDRTYVRKPGFAATVQPHDRGRALAGGDEAAAIVRNQTRTAADVRSYGSLYSVRLPP